MITAIEQSGLKLVSDPNASRQELIPVAVGLGLGWAFVCLWLIVACVALAHFFLWGVLLIGSLSAFATFLGFSTWSMVHDAFRDYRFELTDHDACLVVNDRLRGKRSTQMVLLDDVKYVEYYPYTDSASIIFHASYIQMDVPLWPLGTRGQDVVDFLEGRGVKVVNVQSDDKFPD
jgi:hypothetical protein